MTPAMHVLLLACLLLLAVSAQAQPSIDVRVSDRGLTVQAHAVPLRTLVERVGDRARVTIINAERLDGLASVDLESQAVVEVLATLLDRFNYIITRKPSADFDRGPAYVLLVHSRVDGASPARGPVRVPALEAFRDDDLHIRRESALLNDPHNDDGAAADEEAEAIGELAELDAAGAFGDGVPFTALVAHLAHENPLVRQRAVLDLTRRDPTRALPHIVEALGDEDARLSDEAAEILSRRSDTESLKQLGKVLLKRDADLNARVAAFRIIAVRGDPASVELVRLVTNDQQPVIRDAAAQFLQEMSLRTNTQPR
jgi:HEAT repeat protein